MSKLPTANEMAEAIKKMGKFASDTDVGSNWHERGELPPVGKECEARTQKEGDWCDWKAIEICGYHNGFTWFRCGSSYFHGRSSEIEFRPIRTERDKLIEKATAEVCKYTNEIAESARYFTIATLIDAGWRPIKQQSEGEFLKQCVDICEHGSTLLYRAGCRFIEQGE